MMMNPKKKAILETVLKFLTEDKNHQSLTISNIAKDLDIGKSTIYEYFDSKESMLIDALTMLVEDIITEIIQEDVIDNEMFETCLKIHLKQVYAHAHKIETLHEYAHHPDIRKLPKEAKLEMIEKLQNTTQNVKTYLLKILDKGLQENVIKPINEDKLAVIEGLIFGSVFLKFDVSRNLDEPTLINHIYEAIVTLHR